MPQSGKIHLRFTGAALKKPPDRALIFETIQKQLKLPLTGLRDVKNGFSAFTEFERDIEALLTKNAREKLGALGLEARLPPKVKAQRSVICRRIDPYVGSHDKNELLSDIERNNHHLKVTEVIKFKHHTHVFKIEFETIGMAQHALQNGILCCHVRISPDQIKQEEYVDVLMCFKCYKLNEHTTKDCPTPNLIICSECTGNHDFRECKATVKKCINSQGDHRTMAMSCPKKKEAIKVKKDKSEEDKRQKEDSTYARIVTKTMENVQGDQQKQQTEVSKILAETGIRAMIMVLDAHLHNIMEPGTYNKQMNKTLARNGIAPELLDDNPNTEKLFGTAALGSTLIAMREFTKNKDKEDLDSSLSSSEGEMDAADGRSEHSQDTIDDEIIDRHMEDVGVTPKLADDYEVDIMVEDGLTKKKDLPPEALKKLFKDNKLKYKIRDNSTITPMILEQLIDMGKIKEDQVNIKYVGITEFRKIRNGASRSPAKAETKKAKSILPSQ
jgi:hypothetical protein